MLVGWERSEAPRQGPPRRSCGCSAGSTLEICHSDGHIFCTGAMLIGPGGQRQRFGLRQTQWPNQTMREEHVHRWGLQHFRTSGREMVFEGNVQHKLRREKNQI